MKKHEVRFVKTFYLFMNGNDGIVMSDIYDKGRAK